jgi:hypothetical protein
MPNMVSVGWVASVTSQHSDPSQRTRAHPCELSPYIKRLDASASAIERDLCHCKSALLGICYTGAHIRKLAIAAAPPRASRVNPGANHPRHWFSLTSLLPTAELSYSIIICGCTRHLHACAGIRDQCMDRCRFPGPCGAATVPGSRPYG